MVRLEAVLVLALVALSAPPAAAQTVRDPFADLLARRTAAANQDLIDYNASAERARALRQSGSVPWRYVANDRFRLFNDCAPVTVIGPGIIIVMDADYDTEWAMRDRVTAQIERTAKTRLRNACVLDEQGPERGRFYIEAWGSPDFVYVRASFAKVVIDLATGEPAFTETIAHVGIASARRSRPDEVLSATAAAVLERASTLIDSFVTGYLAANAEACAQRRAR